MGYLGLGADRAGRDKVLDILLHLRPLELALDEDEEMVRPVPG